MRCWWMTEHHRVREEATESVHVPSGAPCMPSSGITGPEADAPRRRRLLVQRAFHRVDGLRERNLPVAPLLRIERVLPDLVPFMEVRELRQMAYFPRVR